MKLINKTNWDTRDLRKILTECIKRDGCRMDLYIRVSTLRQDVRGFVRGNAYINGRSLRLRLKDPSAVNGHKQESDIREQFAQVALHEIAHTRGDVHRDMIGWWEIDASWAKDFPLRLKEVKQKPERDLRWERYEKVLARIVEKERKTKYLQTSLHKLYKKRKYYERVLKV